MMKYNRCKECGEVTPHRVKMGSHNKLVCNKCDIMNEVSERSVLTNILFVMVVILIFLSLIVLEVEKDDFKPLGGDVINNIKK